jgi:hypothetical protein
MARNGSGTFSNPYPNFVSGTVISSTQVDANNSDIATALTQSIAVDGQSTVTANLPMNAKKLTGLAVGAAATDSLNLGQAQAEAMVWCGTAGGSANAITLSPTPAITAYAAGQRFVWKASGSVNTGATTVAISGLGTIALQDNGAALVAGNHAANKIFMGILDTASTVQVLQVQISGTDPLLVSSLTVSGTATVGGILSVDDTTTSTSGTTGSIHTDGGLGVAGTAFVAGAATVGGASQFNSTVTVGVNDTGYDVKLFGATSGKSLLWDESADSLIVTGTTTLVGTTNLDAVDIDGATQIDGTVTVGVNDTGYDVKFFGATSGSYMLWDESIDDLILGGAAQLGIGTASPSTPLHVNGAITVGQINAASGSKIYTVGSGTYELDIAGALTLSSGRDNGASMLFEVSNSEKMRIDAAGKVGIGTASPNTKFTVSGSANLTANFYTPDYGYIGNSAGSYSGINTGWQTLSGGSGYLITYVNGGEKMRILPSGNVGIGLTAPASTLDVNGTLDFTSLTPESTLTKTTVQTYTAGTYYDLSGTVDAPDGAGAAYFFKLIVLSSTYAYHQDTGAGTINPVNWPNSNAGIITVPLMTHSKGTTTAYIRQKTTDADKGDAILQIAFGADYVLSTGGSINLYLKRML